MAKRLSSIPKRLWPQVMAAARAQFVSGNAFGVYAFGIGPHVRRGRRRSAQTLNVYVKRKSARPKAPIPLLALQVGRAAFSVRPNVIATGRRPRAAAGSNVEYSGLHPGAAITVSGPTPGRGAIACILTRGDGPTHAITAGHLFPAGAIGACVFAAATAGAAPRVVGKLVANFLDDSDVDVAVVALTASGVGMVVRAPGPVLADYLAERSVWGKITRAFLATTNDFSREAATTDGPLDVLLHAPTRGDFWVRGVFGTDGEVTNAGDSGTVLCTGATSEYAVGTCSGAFGPHSVFEPIARAIALAKQMVDPDLSLFS